MYNIRLHTFFMHLHSSCIYILHSGDAYIRSYIDAHPFIGACAEKHAYMVFKLWYMFHAQSTEQYYIYSSLSD